MNINKEDQQWRTDFGRMSICSTTSLETFSNDYRYQHRTPERQASKELTTSPTLQHDYDSAVTLSYRDSLSSKGSSLSRASTVSSINTTQLDYDNNITQCTFQKPHTYSDDIEQSPTQQQQQQQKQHYLPVVEPNGCFIPTIPLTSIKNTFVTKHHHVIPTFAMAGKDQADVMNLLFNCDDKNSLATKEEYERTLSWQIDNNMSLITLAQYTCLENNSTGKSNYLSELGQRLGITSILVIVSIETIGTLYYLLSKLVETMAANENGDKTTAAASPSWWKRVIIVVNQQLNYTDQLTYHQQKIFLAKEMQYVQSTFNIPQPLSTLFLSTQTYHQQMGNARTTVAANAFQYKTLCQRILWRMITQHSSSGRWCSESLTDINKRLLASGDNEQGYGSDDSDSDSSSNSGESPYQTVTIYQDGKKQKTKKKKEAFTTVTTATPATDNSPSILQRRVTRRGTKTATHKVHSYDGDDGSSMPLPVCQA